jgi:hypothetical protein
MYNYGGRNQPVSNNENIESRVMARAREIAVPHEVFMLE